MTPSSRRKKQCVLDVRGVGTLVRPAAAANCLRKKLGVVVGSHELRDGRLQASLPEFMLFAKTGPRNSLVIPTGLLERAHKLLEAHGFRVRLRTDRAYPVLSARWHQLLGKGGLDDDAQRLLLRVACWPSGLLRVRGDGGLDRALELLCKFFWDCRVLIVTENKLAARKTGNVLSSQIVGRNCLDWEQLNFACESASVLVLDVQQFARLAPASKDFPVIIFADAKLARGTAAGSSLARLLGSFRFGCLNEFDTCTELDQFVLEFIFGPPLWRQAAGRSRQERLAVVFVEPPHQHAGRRRMDPLERKQKLIWHSAARNLFIASIAQAFADRDLVALHRHGLLMNWSPEVFERFDCTRIVILVEVVEHARQLAQLLPAWRIQSTAEPLAKCPQLPSPALTITTQVYAHQLGPIEANVVLRADGSQGQCANYLRQPKGCFCGLLIDLADDFDAEACRAVHCRRGEYRSLGWASSHLPGSFRPTDPAASAQPRRPARKGGYRL
jgi:hypothetical protein